MSANHKKTESKEETSAINDSGCTMNFMAVSAHLNNVLPTKIIINAKYINGYIIKFTMEGDLDLPILPGIE